MTGFQEIEQPAEALNGAGGTQQAATDILAFMGQSEAEPVEQEQPENIQAEPAETQETDPVEAEGVETASPEQPEGESEYGDIDWSVKAQIREHGENKVITLQELRDGFLRQGDYTRKTNDLAQERQRLEAEFDGVTQQQQQYSQKLNELQQNIEALIPQEPDWGALAAQDRDAYTQQRAAWDQLQGQLKSVAEERERAQQEQVQTWQQQMGKYLQMQQQSLLSAKPELKDQEQLSGFFNDIGSYAQHEYGFTPEELAAVNDHRLWLIAEKARKYDALQSDAGEKKGGKKKIPTLKGGTPPNTKPSSRTLREARAKFNKSGDTRDAAKLIEKML